MERLRGLEKDKLIIERADESVIHPREAPGEAREGTDAHAR
jgi:hypothetical protein